MAEEHKHEEHKHTEETKKQEEHKHEEKKETKKHEHKKKNYAAVNGLNLSISTKEGLHICDMIRYKKVDDAIKMVEEVTKMKRAVPMHNREVGHKKGMMGGRYPVRCAKAILLLLKQLKANAIYNEMEIEDSIISQAITNMASAPFKRGGARAKRAHVFFKLGPNKKQVIAKSKENKHKMEGEK